MRYSESPGGGVELLTIQVGSACTRCNSRSDYNRRCRPRHKITHGAQSIRAVARIVGSPLFSNA